MAELAFAWGAYERTGEPSLVAKNCYAEKVETPDGPRFHLRARPGLTAFKEVGLGPLRGIAQKDGIFSNQALIISGTTAYLLSDSGVVTTLTGTLAGARRVDIALGQDADLNSEAYVATGDALYRITEAGVTAEDFPASGGAGASSVCLHRGFKFATEAGTDQVYYQIPGDTAWTALAFASAEYAPDPIVAIRSRGDQFALLGSSTFEPWALTGDADPAIAPYGGLNGDFGCRARDAAVNCAGTLVWVDSQCNVRAWDGGVAEVVSAPGLADIIRSVDSGDLRAWSARIGGKPAYVLTIGAVATWVYIIGGDGERWTTFDSQGNDYFRGHLGCQLGDAVLVADNIGTQIYRLDADADDDAGDEFAVTVSAMVSGGEAPIPLANLVLVADQGGAPREGQGSAPLVGMRLSRDGGKTFSGWKYRPMGQTGQNSVRPRWNALGSLPATVDGIVQLRVSDPIRRVFKRLLANVP